MSKKLVAYFSASGVTEKMAKTLAEVTGQIYLRFSRQFRIQQQIWTG